MHLHIHRRRCLWTSWWRRRCPCFCSRLCKLFRRCCDRKSQKV